MSRPADAAAHQIRSPQRRRPRLWFAPCAAALVLLAAPATLSQESKPEPPPSSSAPARVPTPTAVHAEISDIIARMNHAIDADDYETYAAFYGTDGYIDSGFGPVSRGRPAIIESLRQSAPFITNKRHVASNIVINRSGAQYVAVYYLTVFERASGLSLAGTALITDTFAKRGGRWEVVSHRTRMDPATLAAMRASAPPVQ